MKITFELEDAEIIFPRMAKFSNILIHRYFINHVIYRWIIFTYPFRINQTIDF